MLPTVSTRTRVCVVLMLGVVTDCDPSLGTLEAMVVGKVRPSSVDSRMLAFAVLIGAVFVPPRLTFLWRHELVKWVEFVVSLDGVPPLQWQAELSQEFCQVATVLIER